MTATRDAGEVVRYDYTPHPAQARAHAVATDELFYGGAAGGGKALPLDTPIPTPTGWTTMGALTPGDRVLGMDGRPTTVTRATGVMHGHDVYRVVFDDGAAVYADADHQWLTYTAADLAALTRRDPAWQARRRASRPRRGTGSRPDLAAANAARAHPPAPVTGGVRTTRDILDTLTTPTGRRNHAIPLPAALDLPHADLPVDPYVLGAWLGDGHSAGGAFTTADQWLVDELRRRGQTVTKWASRYGYGLPGLLPQLRALGVLGNKHIPAAYLRASKAQRLALMQGIVDTDGHVSAHGKVEVTLTRAVLARDVHELALTLGVKATIRETRATLNGRDAGPRWRICWTSTERTALMPRKADRLPVEVRRSTGWRFIVAVEPVPSVPVRCIQVDADDALFLAGRDMVPTHNSRFGRALAVLYALRFPGIKVIIFRRTFPQLRDAVEQPMRAELPPGLATYNKADHTFTFRNGSAIQLGYLRHETDVENYQGAEYQLCVARDTPVLMADGTWRRIDAVRVGEMVQTLQGPREVTATHDMGVKPVARVSTPHGASLVSMRHRVLTASGWAAPGELIPIRSRDAHADGASSAETCPCGGTPHGCSQSDRPRAAAPAQPGAAHTPRPGSCACAAGGRSGCAASGDGRREGPPPAVWCGPLVLYGPDRQSAGIPGPCPCGGGSCAGPASAAPGSTPGCPPCSRCGGGHDPHPAGVGGRACPPSRGGADACSRCVSRADGLGRIPGRTPAGRFEYAHPYTSERVVAREGVHVGPGCMAPAGEAHLWDLTVAGANHYVSWGNIITQNCIFEELTHFTESQYLYMKSRLRAAGPVRDMLEAAGLRPRMVSTGNPGSIGHLWVKARFVDPAPPGTVFRVKPSDRDRNPGTRVFIPARATDNPSLNAEYLQELDQLPPDLRAALRDGDWDRLSGVRFESWDRAVHVIRPEDLPLTPGQGLRAVGVDYGSSAPFAALWGCKLSDDLVVIYRELYLKGLTPRQQAEAIRAAEAEDERIPDARPIPIALDPSTWARAADKPLAQVRNGIPPEGSIARAYHDVFPGQVVKAWNERVAGWALLDEHLRVREDGLPRLLVYNTCTNLIRTLPALPRDARRPEDINTKADDHAADACRYLLAQLAGKHRADPDRPAPPGAALAETADLRTRAW